METEDDCCYVYLDFNEKLTSSVFANKMFLRVANLHKSNPLVQINDLLFKGNYYESVGTNIFFEEVEDPLNTNIFEKNPPIHLKPTIVQTKIIKLKQVKLPRHAPINKQNKESVALNLNQDYNTVLEKLEQGILNVEDLAQKEPEQTLEKQFEEMNFYDSNEQVTTEPERELDTLLEGFEDRTTGSNLESKYERLKRLVRRPVKRMKSPELVEDCEPQYHNAFEYHNLERQICQSNDAFRSVSCPIIEKSFVGGVDMDRCVLQGLLPLTADLGHVLTKDEQRKIFTVDNFENLSLPARYLVLKECVSQIEELIENTSSEELQETDENGRTITDICDIFRRLVRVLEQTMAQSSEGEELNVNVKTHLSERPSEEYIKFRYNPSAEIFVTTEIFNPEEWTEREETKTNESVRKNSGDSDDSTDEDSDPN